VQVPTSPYSKVDNFIDDIIIVGYHSQHWKCLARAALLLLYIFNQPLASNEPILYDDLLALNK